MRFYLTLVALGLVIHTGLAQTPTATALARAAQLTKEKKYESAFEVLDKADPKNLQPEILLAKEKLVLENYLMSMGHQAFGLRDLAPGETVEKLRGKEGNYSMHMLNLPLELNRLQRKYPTNYALSKGLGDYWYAVLSCGCGEQDKPEEQKQDLVLRYYNAAHAHGLGDYTSYFGVGYVQLLRDQFAPATVAFTKSVALKADYPNSHYNLAYALWLQKKSAEGVAHAKAAYDLYAEEPRRRADAARMLGMLQEQQQKPVEAKAAYQQSLALNPQDTPAMLGMLRLAVAAHSPEASSWAAKLYQLNPADDQMFSDIMDIYQNNNQWAEAEAFFSSQLPTAPKEAAPQGLLHFYVAILNMQLKRPQQARPHFLEARKQLATVMKPDNPAMQLIEKGLAESK
ncbi:tetratricopeptide repeat protein [Hymenobacter endophyticus]|uniref:Tetratricopeptide repeat protein n=1 Tax=Hymenobacter endophyticus TaxID=3076335 RepID=A0ABU3TF22_9BACT|nr:tetratricopeptide repeat protein [Hymenobacter endophyticus]MDU0369964.1 tetratricopeptide repeat protein [Hymenobacter endophyticus]